MRLYIAVNELASCGIHRYGTGTVDDAIGNDGLGVNSRKGLGGLVSEDWGLGRHLESLINRSHAQW